jgi:hypothetical protein
MTMAIVASTEPENVWTTEELSALVRDTVAQLLGLDDLLNASDAELANAVLFSEINCQVMPAGYA